MIIVKRLIQGSNNVTRVRVEPRSFNQGRRKNDAFTISATLPTKIWNNIPQDLKDYPYYKFKTMYKKQLIQKYVSLSS